jgi:hypothetical protein
MAKLTNTDVINVLKSASKKDLAFISNVLNRVQKKNVSLYEAARIERHQPGEKVMFNDKNGIPHVGVVKKIMTKRVRVFDKTAKAEISIAPQLLKDYVPKQYKPRSIAVPKAVSGAPLNTVIKPHEAKKVAEAIKPKRAYHRRSPEEIAKAKAEAAKKPKRAYNRRTPEEIAAHKAFEANRVKRKYVRKGKAQ